MPNDDDERLSTPDGLKAIEFVVNYVAGLGGDRLGPLETTDVGLLMHRAYDGLDIEDLDDALRQRGIPRDVMEAVVGAWRVAVESKKGSRWSEVDILN